MTSSRKRKRARLDLEISEWPANIATPTTAVRDIPKFRGKTLRAAQVARAPEDDQDTATRLAEMRLTDLDLTVPPAAKNVIGMTAAGEYEFVVPISSLTSFHRLAWGVKDSATDIVVNLALLKSRAATSTGSASTSAQTTWRTSTTTTS